MNNEVESTNERLAKMNAVAAKLRAEALELELEQQAELNQKLAATFSKLDINKDGSLSVQELKEALSVQLRLSVSDELAQKVLQKFDTSGDGAIQLDEFKGMDAFKMMFERIINEEKMSEMEITKKANLAQKEAKLANEKILKISELVNSSPPTFGDKLVSLLPYILPLCDVLPYSKDFIISNQLENDNIILNFASAFYLLYRSIPFSGLIAFFVLNLLTNNLKVNRLIRFNIQQAIIIDINLFFPAIISSIAEYISTQGNFAIPAQVGDTCSTFIFLATSSAIIYSVISSLVGILPDKIPFVSATVSQRVPSTEEIIKLLDEEEKRSLSAMKDEAEKRKNNDKN